MHIPSSKSDLSGFMNTNLANRNINFLYSPYKKINIGTQNIAPINIRTELENIDARSIVIFNLWIPPSLYFLILYKQF